MKAIKLDIKNPKTCTNSMLITNSIYSKKYFVQSVLIHTSKNIIKGNSEFNFPIKNDNSKAVPIKELRNKRNLRMNSINKLPAIHQFCDQFSECDKITNHRQRRQKSNKSERFLIASLPQVFSAQAKERILSAQINGRLMSSKGMRRKSARNRVILKENSTYNPLSNSNMKNSQNLLTCKSQAPFGIRAIPKAKHRLSSQALWLKFTNRLLLCKQIKERLTKIAKIK